MRNCVGALTFRYEYIALIGKCLTISERLRIIYSEVFPGAIAYAESVGFCRRKRRIIRR